MDDLMQCAVDLARAQASVRPMTKDEIVEFISGVYNELRSMTGDGVPAQKQEEPEQVNFTAEDVKNSIKEKFVICLECGQQFRLLTSRHLKFHGLTAKEYREKYGLNPKAPLMCRALQRDRKKQMTDMRLWERRYNKSGQQAESQPEQQAEPQQEHTEG